MRLSCILATFAFVGSTAVVGQEPSKPNRHAVLNGGAIASQLQSGDRHVVFDYNGSPPTVITDRPAGESRLDALADKMEVIAAVRAESVRSQLVRRDLLLRDTPASVDDANWIKTIVQVRIEDVIKGEELLKRHPGDQLVVHMNGGRAMVQGVLVEAVVPWEVSVSSGTRYLLFGRLVDGELYFALPYAESTSTGLLTRMSRLSNAEGKDVDDIEQWSVNQAAFLMRQRANRNR